MADFSDVSGNRFQDDLRKAAGFKPIIREDLDKAYKRYESAGVKFGRVGNKSDKQLFKMATDDVLRWHKKNKKPVTQPSPARPANASNRLSRTQAASIIRQAGLDPAEVIGFGVQSPSGWINTEAASYVWRSQDAFYTWLKRVYGAK